MELELSCPNPDATQSQFPTSELTSFTRIITRSLPRFSPLFRFDLSSGVLSYQLTRIITLYRKQARRKL